MAEFQFGRSLSSIIEGGNDSKSEAELWEYLKLLNEEDAAFKTTSTMSGAGMRTSIPAQTPHMDTIPMDGVAKVSAPQSYSDNSKSLLDQQVPVEDSRLKQQKGREASASSNRVRSVRDQDARRKQIAHASKRYRQKKNSEYQHLKDAVQPLTERVKQLEVEKVR